ncbi:polynucleotide kinase-phosphatase [Paucisalibacillus sp. EB02]|uniref:polynucleotide kinase-phosphatase n=1 Tax=Paucisalibacillus sp. EB02 TaxID=1347087 RepID=UPI0004B89F84|nr:polynucleotide kinase-phosphatase [Paucisalibacillus sp. EB02]
MEIRLPYSGIVLLVGPSNSGKSTFLQNLIDTKQILSSEVVSSDDFRVLVSNIEFMDWKNRPKDEADGIIDQYQVISKEAFSLMDSLIEKRCLLNKMTFVDATHLHSDDRKRYIQIARKCHVPIMALVFDIDQNTLLARDDIRENPRGKRRIKQQYQTFKREKRFIKKEGYIASYFLSDMEDITLIRKSNNPIEINIDNGVDIIGDIHGCYDEMILLLEKLGYEKNRENYYIHPDGRRFLSLGDIMSRGPKSLDTMEFFLRHVNVGLAYMIDSNHGWKIARWLDGRKVTLSHGDELIEEEINQFQEQYGEERTKDLKQQIKQLLLNAPSHYVLTKNSVPIVVCTHAGIKDEFIGKQSYEISDFCRYGDTGGFDESGKPIRKDWTIHHKTNSLIVWGHDPKPRPLIINNTINIDQGVVFGGELTAFQYPEKEFVSVKAAKDYSDGSNNPLIEWEKNRLNPPNITKFVNGYSVLTDDMGEIHVPKKHAIPAIDTVSHFTVPMEELVYIPPTMSPTPKPSVLDDYLEHPREVIEYYRSMGIERMVAEKKHMGSRGVLLLFKDRETGLNYVGRETLGVIYTRTGRRFFKEETEKEILLKINKGLRSNDYFRKYDTDYVLLDAEIMPWNLKAKELISNQYAHVSENAILDRRILKDKLKETVHSNPDVENWLQEYEEKLNNAHVFHEVFQKYCWDVEGIKQIQIAPFHVLAHSKQTFFHKAHTWHMEMNREFAKMIDIFVETEYMVIEDNSSEEAVTQWWEAITTNGHEGIVIKPEFFISKHKGKLIQPAMKVRGRKYLNIIYGMDYLNQDNLTRLKERNTSKKQKLALREFALGVEGINRFVNGESIERVHECVLGALAMESDPVDPRL